MFFSSREVNDVGSLALGIVQETTEVRFNEVGVFVADVVYGLHRVHDVQTMQTCERNASNEGFRNTPFSSLQERGDRSARTTMFRMCCTARM